jgi:uncharacterized membrane protein YvlD (DUF360 family)
MEPNVFIGLDDVAMFSILYLFFGLGLFIIFCLGLFLLCLGFFILFVFALVICLRGMVCRVRCRIERTYAIVLCTISQPGRVLF